MTADRTANPQPLAAAALRDARGDPLTGATPHALGLFEQALAAALAWRGGADAPLAHALQDAPGFVMAHVLEAWMLAAGRDERRIRAARAPLARAQAAEPRHERERLHLAALQAVIDDDYPGARALLGRLLRLAPHDVLALQVAHGLDYLTGDIDALAARPAQALATWGRTTPSRHAVLAMQAFGRVETGEPAEAEADARAALALDPGDARAHHVMAHVFEATGRAAEGARWLEDHAGVWSASTAVATHCAWHLAVFRLALGQPAQALALHDRHMAASPHGNLADLIDASALLWRIALQGADVGGRWQALADAWAPRIDDAWCSFSDVHAMLAFVGARDRRRADALLAALAAAAGRPTRHGRTTRELGLPACRALAAFGAQQYPLAITLLASLPATAHRLGGSHAQRDVLHLTLLQAVERIRRPAPRRALLRAA